MSGSRAESAAGYLRQLKRVLDRIDGQAIDALAERVFQACSDGKQVLVFGNGGSAYTASHFVTDLVKTAAVEGCPRLRAISLVDNYGLTTALGNDIDYEDTFLFPLTTYARPGDVAIAISGSGNSSNVVKACEWARDNGLTVVALTGFKGGKIAELCHLHIHVPSDNYGIIEDLHLAIGHMISQALKARLLTEAPAL